MRRKRDIVGAPVVHGDNHGVVATEINGPIAIGPCAVASSHTTVTGPQAPATEPQTVRIFLASSIELSDDRNGFDLHLRQLNDQLRQEQIYLKVVRWENAVHALSRTRKQDEYNQLIADSDIFVSLFATKVGRFTEEEFDVALDHYQRTERPLIYTFFKAIDPKQSSADAADRASLRAFQVKLTQLGHFWSAYTSVEDLQLQFGRQLDTLLFY